MPIRIICLLILLVFFCCEFEETNLDPTRETKVALEELLPSAQTQLAHTRLALPGRMIGIFLQHFQGADDQVLDWTNYNVKESDFDALWSEGLYAGSMKDCKRIIDIGTEGRRPYYVGIGLVLMAQNLALVTSFWGDAPFTEALSINNISPRYDAQEHLMDTIQSMLDEAILNFTEYGIDQNDKPPSDDDLIYQGNIELWTKTAWALKTRYQLWMSNKDSDSYNKILNLISENTILANEVPNFTFSTSLVGANPYALFGGGGRAGTMFVHDNFIERLDERNDPRKNKYAILEETTGLYSMYKDGLSGPVWGRNNSVVPLISFAELKFIESESWLFIDEMLAETSLYQAIEASMLQLKLTPTEYNEYLSENGNFNGLGTLAEKLEHILTEKYIALFAQSEPEIWVDYRRTGFPNLEPVNSDGNGVNPSRVIPRRFIYPLSERLANQINLTEAVERQGNGTGLLDDRLWLFQ